MRSNLIQSTTRGVNLLQVYTNYEIARRIFEQECKSRGISKELLNELVARLASLHDSEAALK